MKKLFGLMAVVTLVACSGSSDDSVPAAPSNNPAATIVDPQGAVLVYDAASGLYFNQATMQYFNQTLGVYVDPTTGLALPASSAAVVVPASSAAALPMSSEAVIVEVSSSSVAPAPVVVSSSSVAPVPASSATVAPKSSAAVTPQSTGFSLTLWDAADGDPHVLTGDKSGGWWYDYGNEGSSVTWVAELGEKGDKTPVIEACGGICGDFTVGGDADVEYPYVGVGFDYAEDGSASDASAMKGVCVTYTYSGDADFAVELGMIKAQEDKLGSALPMYILPSGTKKTADLAWADFEQPSWAETAMSGANAAKQLKALKFKLDSPKKGDTGSFAIYKVGPKGSCN